MTVNGEWLLVFFIVFTLFRYNIMLTVFKQEEGISRKWYCYLELILIGFSAMVVFIISLIG